MSSMVVVRCPATDEEVPTGLVMGLMSFSHLALTKAELSCPSCGATHMWSKDDAWLSISKVARLSHPTNAVGRSRRD
jgi:hypothetical protein